MTDAVVKAANKMRHFERRAYAAARAGNRDAAARFAEHRRKQFARMLNTVPASGGGASWQLRFASAAAECNGVSEAASRGEQKHLAEAVASLREISAKCARRRFGADDLAMLRAVHAWLASWDEQHEAASQLAVTLIGLDRQKAVPLAA